ncbi:MAG TPA: hypothetical protein EYO88_12550 [Alphaproteobacteria bacterium]|nr:hypothetical protein [Alphaproteobacteria bacterium]
MLSMTKYNSKFKDKAYGLFVQGMPLTQIAKELGVNRKTIKQWSEISTWEIRKRIPTPGGLFLGSVVGKKRSITSARPGPGEKRISRCSET